MVDDVKALRLLLGVHSQEPQLSHQKEKGHLGMVQVASGSVQNVEIRNDHIFSHNEITIHQLLYQNENAIEYIFHNIKGFAFAHRWGDAGVKQSRFLKMTLQQIF